MRKVGEGVVEESPVEFKEGDKVMLKESSKWANLNGSNPTDVIGEVVGVSGDSGWYEVKWSNGASNGYEVEEDHLELVGRAEKPVTGKIKSDGSSSSYYDLPLSEKLLEALNKRNGDGQCFIKVEEMIDELFEDSFVWGTMFKSMVRGYLQTKGGGKEGNDLEYEMNKVLYYANKVKEKSE